MKKAIKKLKSNIGFTLSETLMTVLILVMVAGVVAEGVPAAVRAFGKAVEAANTQMAISTTVNALRSELATAWSVECKNNEIVYISSKTGAKTKIYRDSNDKNIIKVQDFLNYESETEHAPDAEPHALVSESAVTKNQLVTFDSVAWDKDGEGKEDKSVLVFSDLKVIKNDAASDDNTALANVEKLYIRILTTDLAIPFIG